MLFGASLSPVPGGRYVVHNHLPGPDQDQSWVGFWQNHRGYKRDFTLQGAAHNSFTDFQPVYDQIAARLNVPPDRISFLVGTIDPDRSTLVQRTYLAAYFDHHLQGRNPRLLNGPSTSYPEIAFVP